MVKSKYCGALISCYSNSVATHQILLLKCGDISPNPGPLNEGNASSDSHLPNQRVTYDCNTLRSMKPAIRGRWSKLDENVLNTIIDLGIKRKRKTHRGKRGAGRLQRPTIIVNQRASPFRPSAASSQHAAQPHVHKKAVPQSNVSFCMINARSLKNKSAEFVDFVTENNLHIVGICETWLTPDDVSSIGHLTPSGFTFLHVPRKHKRGGGVAVLLRSNLQHKIISSSCDIKTFELIQMDITHNSRTVHLIIVYRPPNSSPIKDFLDEFSNLLDEQLYARNSDLIISGDFNIQMDSPSTNAREFSELLTAYNLKQHIRVATHSRGHTLDLLITRHDDITTIHNIRVNEGISDHAAIMCELNIPVEASSKQLILTRNMKSIDIDKLCQDQ